MVSSAWDAYVWVSDLRLIAGTSTSRVMVFPVSVLTLQQQSMSFGAHADQGKVERPGCRAEIIPCRVAT